MRKTFIIVLWALLIVGILATYIIFSAISDGKIGYVPPIEELENPNLKFATQVISDDGKVLGTWSLSKENRLYVGYNDLSPNLVHALVATEDVRFSEHSGWNVCCRNLSNGLLPLSWNVITLKKKSLRCILISSIF